MHNLITFQSSGSDLRWPFLPVTQILFPSFSINSNMSTKVHQEHYGVSVRDHLEHLLHIHKKAEHSKLWCTAHWIAGYAWVRGEMEKFKRLYHTWQPLHILQRSSIFYHWSMLELIICQKNMPKDLFSFFIIKTSVEPSAYESPPPHPTNTPHISIVLSSVHGAHDTFCPGQWKKCFVFINVKYNL